MHFSHSFFTLFFFFSSEKTALISEYCVDPLHHKNKCVRCVWWTVFLQPYQVVSSATALPGSWEERDTSGLGTVRLAVHTFVYLASKSYTLLFLICRAQASSCLCFPAAKDLLTWVELVSLLFWIAPNQIRGRIDTHVPSCRNGSGMCCSFPTSLCLRVISRGHVCVWEKTVYNHFH